MWEQFIQIYTVTMDVCFTFRYEYEYEYLWTDWRDFDQKVLCPANGCKTISRVFNLLANECTFVYNSHLSVDRLPWTFTTDIVFLLS